MSINSRVPLWGLDRNGAKRWVLLAGCLLVAATVIYLVRPVAGTIGNGELTASDSVDGLLWITALLVGPFLVAAANAYVGGGVADSLAVGTVPAIGFVGAIPIARLLGTGGNGDTALWLLVLVFVAIGVAGAFAGFIVSTVGRLVGERLGLDRQ